MRWQTTPRDQWHVWFAWYPVRITGTSTIVWLESIERWYGPTCYVPWQYRDKERNPLENP